MPASFRALSVPLLAALCLSVAPAPAWADVPISDSARAHFNAGVNLLQDPDGARYEEAYREFKAAYADSPSWKMLGNLGLAAMKLERDGEAIEAYEKYLSEGGSELDPEERSQIERDLATLSAGVVKLELELPAGASVVDERIPVRERPVLNLYEATEPRLSLGIRAGHHRFTVRLAGHQDAVWEVDARPGSRLTHRFELVPLRSPASDVSDSGLPSSAWSTQKTLGVALGGLGVVSAVVGTVFFFQYKSSNDDAKAVCSGGTACPEGSARRHSDLVDDARSARTFTYVGWGLGAAALVAGGALYFSASSPKAEAQATSTQPHGWSLVPALSPEHVGAHVSGRF